MAIDDERPVASERKRRGFEKGGEQKVRGVFQNRRRDLAGEDAAFLRGAARSRSPLSRSIDRSISSAPGTADR